MPPREPAAAYDPSTLTCAECLSGHGPNEYHASLCPHYRAPEDRVPAIRPRDVSDVLLALSREDFNILRERLARKLERAKAEVARLEFERDQLDEAARIATLK